MSESSDGGRPLIGISSCLLGDEVRFDGGHKHDRYLTDILGPFVEWVPVCPEVDIGMGVPRPSVQLQGDVDAPRMVEGKSGHDWTGRMQSYARRKVQELQKLDLSGYVLKKGSPTCGMERVRVYPEKGGQPARKGRGLFAAALMEHLPLLPVEEEGRLNDARLRENFIERVFAYRRWQDLCVGRKSRGALVDFHARHKLILLAHSEAHMRKLGRLVAGAKGRPIAEVYDEYGREFMAGLGHQATTKKQVNVMQHIIGHFSDRLTGEERQELLDTIRDYHRYLVPLIVPLTLIRHYVRKHQVPYITDQLYLQPHPKELMLRNHV